MASLVDEETFAKPVVAAGSIQDSDTHGGTSPKRGRGLTKNTSKMSLQAKRKSIQVPAIILLAFTVPASFLYGISLIASVVIASPDACNDHESVTSTQLLDLIFIGQMSIVFLLFPFAGWLSDTKLGKYRAIYYSIWLMWCGVGVVVVSYILRRIQPCDADEPGLQAVHIIGKYVAPIVCLILISMGAAGYFPNILAFIMEQLMESPSTLVRSYIYWFSWAVFVGFFFADWITVQLYIDVDINDIDEWVYIPTLCCFAYFSVVLIVCFYFEKVFMLSNVKKDPYSMVYRVVCFAIKHNHPINPSSLTFTNDNVPSRLDFAKEKYGGPFKQEQVEDVKTLFRIVVVFFSLLPFFVAYAGPVNQLVPYIQHLSNSYDNNVGILLIYLSESSLTIVAIPILELVLLPLFPKLEFFIQKPLRWIFAGVVALALCNISLAVIDGSAHAVDNETFACFINNRSEALDDFDYRWVVIPTFFWAVCDLFITTSLFTFICSQAPYSMNGMLLGLFMFMQGGFRGIGNIITVGFDWKNGKDNYVISCGFWYWFTLSIFSIIGCVVFFIAARSYKSRSRWEFDNYREIIENIYERQLQETSTYSFSYIKVMGTDNIHSENQ